MRQRLGSFIRHNAIGLIALVVAMSGVAYAAAPKNSVTSKSIKDKSVKTIDLGDAAVTSLQVADDSLGGGDIADDSIGDLDISDLTAASLDLGVHAVFNFNTTTTDTVSVTCPAGELALGGGPDPAVVVPNNPIEVSKPTGVSPVPPVGDPTGWTVRYQNAAASPVSGGGIGVWAICMPQ
jgi:hypothetical protein